MRIRQIGIDLLLLLVTFFWGSTFTIVKSAVAQVDVFAFLTVRFAVAFLLMVSLFHRRILPPHAPVLRAGILLGILLFAAFAFQTWGLTLTTATNGALITGLNVVMVPMLCLFLLRRPPAASAVAGVLLASAGLYLLTGGAPSQWNRGDLLVLICAIWIALHILLTGYYAPQQDTLALATWQVGTVAALSLASSLSLGTFTLRLPGSVWLAVGITAVLATVFAFVVQTYAQRYTPPTRTALIFTGEPVFGALFAHWCRGEPLLRPQIGGGGLIILGMVLAEIRPGLWNKVNALGNQIASWGDKRSCQTIPPPRSSASE